MCTEWRTEYKYGNELSNGPPAIVGIRRER